RVGIHGHRQILAVVDRPVVRDAGEVAVARVGAKFGEEKARLPLTPERRREEGYVEDDGEALDDERGVGGLNVGLEVGLRRAHLESPGRVVSLAGGEGALADAVDALPQLVHAVGGKMVIRWHVGGALVDDAGPGPHVEVDPLPHQSVLAVEEHGPTLSDGLPGRAVELDPVGDEAVVPPCDLDIARGQIEIRVAPDLLNSIGDHIGVAARAWEGQGRRLLSRSWRRPDEPECTGDEPRDDHPSEERAAQTEGERRVQRHRGIWYQREAASKPKISVFSVAWTRISPRRKSDPAIQTVVVPGWETAIRSASRDDGAVSRARPRPAGRGRATAVRDSRAAT